MITTTKFRDVPFCEVKECIGNAQKIEEMWNKERGKEVKIICIPITRENTIIDKSLVASEEKCPGPYFMYAGNDSFERFGIENYELAFCCHTIEID